MKIMVVGATGAIGQPLVPLLAAAGHEVVAASRRARPQSAGGTPGVVTAHLDVLDKDAVLRVVAEHRPDAIIHIATAIPDPVDPRRIGRLFEQTNRLRITGTANLVTAAEAHGVQRLVCEGLAYAYHPGDAVRSEDAPLWRDPPKSFAPVVEALRELEEQTQAAGGTVLRFGHLYGPGTVYAPEGSLTAALRNRKLPVVGRGASWFSFVHVDDAAAAILAAIDRPLTGTFNVVDDVPILAGEWLPWLAQLIGATPPRRVPASIARLAVGPYGVTFMNGLAGASNARARESLRWQPRFASVREGFVSDFAAGAAATERS
jgi:nucleoside-diphosphate-sugar epimerase